MKYIRTNTFEEEEIINVSNWEYEDGIYFTDKYTIFENEILKQADTIEELCDEFVYEILTGEIEEPMYRDIHKARIDIKTQLKIYDDNMISVCAIYGAIWTDKGLIYVAKMNEKGELELL